jgi:hypothetical protein
VLVRWAWLVVVMVAGCYKPVADPDCVLACSTDENCPGSLSCGASGLCSVNGCAGDIDAGQADARLASCGIGFAQPCLPIPEGDIELTGPRSTDDDLPCTDVAQASGPAMCVVSSDTITTTVGFRATGSKPLVLVARVITVHGLSVSSFRADSPITGAGACTATGPDGTTGIDVDNNKKFGAGGAGGTFQGRGGRGGNANVTGVDDGIGGTGTPAFAFPTEVIGGCAGGRGAEAGGIGGFGPGGAGGGAAYLLATESISVDGLLTACGSGGRGGSAASGGGGGGAGGLIVLDAPKITLTATAKVIASGGGGAAGGDADAAGLDGREPNVGVAQESSVTANGGTAATDVGRGGVGSASGDGGTPVNLNGGGGSSGNNSTGGGGGGGGAAGWIIVYTPNAATIDAGTMLIPLITTP